MSRNINVPRFRVLWVRGGASATLDFKRPSTWLVLGGVGGGKSSLLEARSCRFEKIIDLFGSRDNEGLAWLRSPFHSKNEILLLTGDSVELKGKWDVQKVREITLKDLKSYRVITSVSALYSTMDEEFRNLNDLVFKVLYQRSREGWRELWGLKIREASNFLYSRVRITRNQVIAKNDFLYLLREMRHGGYSVSVDTIRWTSIDKEVRDTSDTLFIKNVGILGLPRDLRFIYRYIDPYSLMDPDPSVFVVVNKRGAIGVGNFDYPKFHKEENENLLKEFGLNPEYGEIPKYGDEDARNVVGDFEHHDIIVKRIDGVFGEGKKKSMRQIGVAIGRSSKTIHDHITDHNRQVATTGECPRCRRIGSPHATTRTEAPR